ncbi:Indole-3-acetaldehyde reductase (NADH), partial [Fusarium beomiforme]
MSSQRCDKCAPITTEFILSPEFKGAELKHYDNFSILEQSAAAGCDLCRLIRQYLIHHAPTEPHSQTKVEDINHPITLSRPQGFKALVVRMGPVEARMHDRHSNDIAVNGKESRSDTKPIHRFTTESCQRDVDQLAKEVIRPWIDRCFLSTGFDNPPNNLHKYCIVKNKRWSMPRARDIPSLPTRVIDVGLNGTTPHLRVRHPWTPANRYERDPECAQYLILSYCWGRGNETAKTTKANLQERMKKIDVNSLPKTVRDAIHLTRALGERYLFVDAVCIVQPSGDDNGDWLAEAPRMGDYYGNALFTISATGVADSADGFFHERAAQRFPEDSCALSPWITTDKTESIYIHPSTPLWWNSVVLSPLYQRGWAVQERALSPRILHWTAHALYWECSGMRASEYRPDGLTMEESRLVHENLQKEVHMNLGTMMKYSRNEILCWAWYRLIERYTWTRFTYTSDKLIALAGVAKRTNVYHPDRYATGIWSENLIEGLAWHTRYYKTNGPQRPTKYIAPSWSWASVDATVKFVVLGISSWEWLATVVQVNIVPSPGGQNVSSSEQKHKSDPMGWKHGKVDDNIYGFISRGELSIRGIIRELRFNVEPQSSNPGCLYYTSTTTSTTSFLPNTPEKVLLDAPLGSKFASSRTFHCLLFGRQKKSMLGLTQLRDERVLTGYLILEATGKLDQYRRVGWAE